MDFFDILLAKKLEDDRDPTIEGLSVTENGIYSEENKAYNPVIVEVPEPTLKTKTITENGTYTASADNADGYSSVTVEVPLPSNAHLATPITSQPIANASTYPLPKCDVTVSNADKCEVIVTNDGQITEDSMPYLNRHSAGGNTELDEIIGGSIVWNQLVGVNNIRDSRTTDDVTFTKNNDGTFTMNGTASRSDWYICAPYPNEGKMINGHVYYAFNANKNGAIDTFGIGTSGFGEAGDNITIYGNIGKVMRANGNNGALTYVYKEGVTINNETLKPILISLTAVFGTTIADYIYSLEQSTAGSGIAWLKSYGFLTEDYYPYNAGELMSVKTSGHIMRDGSNNIIGNYPLSPIELRGIPKLDANNKLYYDGDSYRCDGRVKRRYGIVDLGTLNWDYDSKYALFISKLNDAKVINNSRGVICVCDKYLTTGYASISWSTFPDKCISAGNNYSTSYNLAVKDTAYTDTTAFKTAMSGVMLVYELATPTEEYTYSFEKNQTVDANGTEEYIDDRTVAIPVGHSTKYYHGKAYTKYFAEKSGVVNMADEGIMPTNPMYINANGNIDAEYWT